MDAIIRQTVREELRRSQPTASERISSTDSGESDQRDQCSATFEQLLAFWATLCSTSNLGQLLPSLATFEQQIDIKSIQTIKGRFISKDFIKTGFIKTDFIKTKDIQ